MNIDSGIFRVREGKKAAIKQRPTLVEPFYRSKKEYRARLAEYVKALASMQRVLYAHDQYAVLVIFQAMDAAGKDGVIRHVLSGINPQGCQVFSFKHPSATELDHDFLWRTNQCLPERGRIGIFNRSYYEEVLIVRVHPEILQGQAVPRELAEKKEIWQGRYASIRELEAHLHRNGTRVLKVFLNISQEEQRKRFLARIDNPEKNWKFSAGDLKERAFWKEYMTAYEACLTATSTNNSPWYVVPADDKANARLIVARIVLDTFKGLNLSYPKPDNRHLLELQELRTQLLAEGEK